MTKSLRRRLTVTFRLTLFTLLLFSGRTVPSFGAPPSGADQPLVVIPFDFESKFDSGRYGRMVGDMIWQKLNRRGVFVIPETMLDVRDWSTAHRTTLGPDTPLAKIREIIREDFGADVAIWGKVERLPNVDWDEYDLWINVVNFSGQSPREIARIKARTKTVSEIPHVYVKQALDKLYGVDGSGATNSTSAAAEELWKSGPNLVQGDFETGQGWDPLNQYVTRVSERDSSHSSNHVLRFTIPKSVAATTGVLYYSDYFPVTEGARYRFQCRWRSTGSAVKVFIKCYDELPTRFERRGENVVRAMEKREVYRSQQNLKGPSNTWNVQTEDFTPKHTQYVPRWGRVMLYGYWPEGTVEWDRVVVKKIVAAPLSSPKTLRHSLETKSRIETPGQRKSQNDGS